MKKVCFILLITISLFAHTEDEKAFISGFKQTLINKGTKLLDKTKKTAPKGKKNKSHELIVDLRNPSYKNGILTTHEGGIIKGEDIRIQAKTIQYIKREENNKPVHKIEAEGDLIIQYKGKVYVGDELEYDFITRTGIVYEGKTFTSPWYLGGDKIELKSDGSYRVENVFITTCENTNSTWDIHAGKVNVLKKDLLEAKKVRFRFFKFPSLWLPSFKVNLKRFFGTPLFRYKVNWDKSSGPRGSLRYRFYSWEDFALWGRVEYRLRKGWGGAIETEYYPEHGRTKFETKNYLASDVVPNNLEKKRRYRIQGVYRTISPSEKTKADIIWDKYSDIRMPSDFKSDDFELNTAKKSELNIRHQEDQLLAILYARPRVNSFNTVKQSLPASHLNIKPYKSDSLGIVLYNNFRASYLDYAFSDKLSPSLKDINSARLETHNEISRPLKSKYLSLIPYVGFEGLYFNDSPTKNSKKLLMFLYGGTVKTDLNRKYTNHRHIIEPYLKYQGITRPTSKVDSYYIFSIQDGYNKLNLIRTGIKNQVYSLKNPEKPLASFDIDLYTNIFIGSNFIPRTIPKIYLDFNWNLPSVYFNASNAYNFFAHTLDYTNLRLGWTVNSDIAFAVEFRYRSSYDYRKSNHNNFIVDVSRKVSILLESPMSDKRNTILSHAYFRLNPYWTCEFHSHHGWNRKNEPPYNEYKIDLYTMLSSSWRARVSYQHTESDDRFSGSIDLIK